VHTVAGGRAPLDRLAGRCRAFVRLLVVRHHPVGLDVDRNVADHPKTVDCIGRKLDGELVLEFRERGEQPEAAQAKVLEVIASKDRDIASSPAPWMAAKTVSRM
jgi:hypothetical protein